MKWLCILLFAWCFQLPAFSQEIVYDLRHLVVVTENHAARSAAEVTHQQYLSEINDNLNTINLNAATVVAAQTLIYNALANVNSALKDGLMVRSIGRTTGDILYYLDGAAKLGKADPLLFLVAMRIQQDFGPRVSALVSDISGFILKEGDNVLANYNGRDQLLRRVVQELQMLDGLAYGAWKAMYWAKAGGLLKTLNPFRQFISRDRAYAAQIIQNAKYLNK